MHRIEGPGATVDKKFTEGNPATGVLPTEVTDKWLNAVQEELANAIEASGRTLKDAATDTHDQLAAVLEDISAGSDPNLRSDLASPAVGKGSKLIAFIQRIAGAVARWSEDKLSESVSVKDFGAKGDGATDDRTAILLASAAHFPAGTYRIASNATITAPISAQPGASIKPDSGVVVTISGPINVGDLAIFDTSAGGSFKLPAQSELRLSWFGMKTSNSAAANTAAFNSAIGSLSGTSGVHVRWPAGAFNVNPCVHARSSIWQEGHGDGTWIINNSPNDFALSDTAGQFHNRFSNLYFGQSASVTAVSGNGGLQIRSTQSGISDINCSRFPAPLYDGIYINSSSGVWVLNCRVDSTLHDGFHLGGACSDIFLEGTYSIGNVGAGYRFNGASGVYGTGVNAYGNGTYGFHFDSVGTANPSGKVNEYFFGSQWVADSSANHNWYIDALVTSQFGQCWGATQKSAAINTAACGVFVAGSNVADVSFAGLITVNNNSNGVYVNNGASNISFTSGCISKGNGASGAGSGYRIAFCTDITVNGCMARNNASSGLLTETGSSDYLCIVGNNFRNNTGASLSNNSTGTHNQIANNVT